MIKIAFFGTSDRSIPLLDALNDSDKTELVLTVTKDDVKTGRSQELKETGVKKWSKEHRIKCLTTNSLRGDKDKVIEQLNDSDVVVVIVADFSFMIPVEIIKTPPFGLVNVHFSLLPRWRGASPVQFAILNGDKTTGITFHLVSKEIDRGAIIGAIEYKIDDKPNAKELNDVLFKTAAKKLPKIIHNYVSGKIQPQPQNESLATYTYSPTQPKSTFVFKEDGRIDWRKPAMEIDRMVRAYNPWPVAWTTLSGLAKAKNITIRKDKDTDLKVKIYKVDLVKNELEIATLQIEGRKIMDWKDFLNGYAD